MNERVSPPTEYAEADAIRTHVRSLGSSRSAIELRPLVVQHSTTQLNVRTAFLRISRKSAFFVQWIVTLLELQNCMLVIDFR
jgi:hypothetical protein